MDREVAGSHHRRKKISWVLQKTLTLMKRPKLQHNTKRIGRYTTNLRLTMNRTSLTFTEFMKKSSRVAHVPSRAIFSVQVCLDVQ